MRLEAKVAVVAGASSGIGKGIVPALARGRLQTGGEGPTRGLLAEVPPGRMAEPEEVGGLAVYPASDAASCVTGGTFVIDGGMMRQSGSL